MVSGALLCGGSARPQIDLVIIGRPEVKQDWQWSYNPIAIGDPDRKYHIITADDATNPINFTKAARIKIVTLPKSIASISACYRNLAVDGAHLAWRRTSQIYPPEFHLGGGIPGIIVHCSAFMRFLSSSKEMARDLLSRAATQKILRNRPNDHPFVGQRSYKGHSL